jgi:hypothetical protein
MAESAKVFLLVVLTCLYVSVHWALPFPDAKRATEMAFVKVLKIALTARVIATMEQVDAVATAFVSRSRLRTATYALGTARGVWVTVVDIIMWDVAMRYVALPPIRAVRLQGVHGVVGMESAPLMRYALAIALQHQLNALNLHKNYTHVHPFSSSLQNYFILKIKNCVFRHTRIQITALTLNIHILCN